MLPIEYATALNCRDWVRVRYIFVDPDDHGNKFPKKEAPTRPVTILSNSEEVGTAIGAELEMSEI